MVAYGRDLHEPRSLGPRQRLAPTEGLENSSYLKKKSQNRKYQQNQKIASEDFRNTAKIAVLLCIFVCMILMMQLGYPTRDPTPISAVSNSANDNQGQKDLQGQSKLGLTTIQRPVSDEVQSMLRRVKKSYLVVRRNARKSSCYYKSNPSLEIPKNLDTLLADTSGPRLQSQPIDVPLFWHILKSGGTTVKDAAGMCLGKVEASESGVLDGHASDSSLKKVQISQGAIQYVNVDTTTQLGIQRASAMGLVNSELADVIFSPLLHESAQLFHNTTYKGRAFCLFRHPVERAISLFHYLKNASWEPTFSEKLKSIQTVEDYAISEFAENNWMTRFLTNEMSGTVTRKHLEIAKEIIRRKIFVGLTLDLEHSFERFIKYFGWENGILTGQQRSCLKNYLSTGSNRNNHRVEEDSMGWRVLRGNNLLDLELYDYVLQIYEEQASLVSG